MQVERAVRARGIASEARISDYYRVKGKRRTLAPAIEELVAAGVLERLRMRELGDTWLVPAEDAERAIAGDEQPTGAFLLSPFDNLLWDRFEAEHLFGFEHRLEIYKPAPTRIYGYYVLPLLDGPDIVRPHRPQGRPQGRYAAGPGGALAEAAEAARAARGAGAARPCARAREERDREWSLRRVRSTPGRSPTR